MLHYTSKEMQYPDFLKHTSSLMTYCHVVEAQGHQMPTNQRARNLISVLAAGVEAQPLAHSLAIFDKTQSLGRNGNTYECNVGALATSSSLFPLGTAYMITTAELAELMGHDRASLSLQGISEGQFRHMIGMSLREGVAGLLMLGLLATLGC